MTLFLFLLAMMGAVDPCDVPDLASNPAFADQCDTEAVVIVADAPLGALDISNGF